MCKKNIPGKMWVLVDESAVIQGMSRVMCASHKPTGQATVEWSTILEILRILTVT